SGLLLGVILPPMPGGPFRDPEALKPNAWVRIALDGTVTVWVHRSEMGQGVRTSLPMILAEELEVGWAGFEVAQGDADPKYGSQTTGGSASIRTSWEPLRKAGAAAREMLRSAAAREWDVDPSTCRAADGAIVHEPTGRRLAYGELAERAASLPVPEEPALKDPAAFTIVGTSKDALDHAARVRGRARFGFDVKIPEMRYACLARPPAFGGSVKAYDADAARAVEGVEDVVEVDTGVAVIATSTWAALQGVGALSAEFDPGPNGDVDDAEIARRFDRAEGSATVVTRDDGDFDAAFERAARRVEAVYEVPFLSHATMEPQNCVARWNDDGGVELWAPSQAPQMAWRAVAEELGVPQEKVTLHVTLIGGGFGRRLMPDVAVEAAAVAKAAGVPVQVVWTREDDMRHDFYRPASRHRLRAGLDEEGRIVAWHHRVVAPSIVQPFLGADDERAADEATGGATQLPYAIPNVRVDWSKVETPVPTGWWRSVFNTQTALANECFLDELAAETGRDPYEWRMELLEDEPRHRGVLEAAAGAAGWDQPPAEGRHRGLAVHASFRSYAAEVAEISMGEGGRPRVHRVVAAIDCGRVINPDGVAAQIEGGIALALGTVLHSAIAIENGGVKQKNFYDYPLTTIAEMPEVETHLVESDEEPTGVGEPPVPPLAPAVVNAMAAATGERIRRLPVGPVTAE
ncbi:MAG: molybdopterin cofactor-binding domain-containing protein, partial [Gemmatimonadota bacterium]|nr:molybdopterin cofactor-binding domain-containing protein [Gemmatimonadota bacterium]